MSTAFGKQDYNVNGRITTPIPDYVTYDYQIMPNLSYRFMTKNERLTLRLALTPKIYRAQFESNFLDGMRDVPTIWGGISIGYSW